MQPLSGIAPSRLAGLRRAVSLASTDLSSAVYGSLLVTALVVVEMQSEASAELVAVSIVTSVSVFWLAHVWAALVNLRLRAARVTHGEVIESALAELPMLIAAVPPVLALVAARAAGATVGQAEVVALAFAVAGLFAWGLSAGRVANRGWAAAIATAMVDVGLGLVIVSLKAIAVH